MNIETLEYKLIECCRISTWAVSLFGRIVEWMKWKSHLHMGALILRFLSILKSKALHQGGWTIRTSHLLNYGECGEWNTKYGPTWQWITSNFICCLSNVYELWMTKVENSPRIVGVKTLPLRLVCSKYVFFPLPLNPILLCYFDEFFRCIWNLIILCWFSLPFLHSF